MDPDIELEAMNELAADATDFYKIPPGTKTKIKRIWEIVSFGLSWLTVALYIWDCIASFLSYKFWMKVAPNSDFKDCFTAWLTFSIIGTILATLFVYNTLMHSIKHYCHQRKVHYVCHQYSAFIEYYTHEIPKSIVFLVIMIKFSIIPDEPGMKAPVPTTMATLLFLGHSKYDHIYYKIIFDALKMLGFFVLGVIEFIHIVRTNHSKVFLSFNCIGEIIHLSLLIATTVYKIKIEIS